MPLISRFFGISIYMYYEDHAPPHFHCKYGDSEALININELMVIKGDIPPRALGLVIEWATQHKAELLENWHRGENFEAFEKIDPLT